MIIKYHVALDWNDAQIEIMSKFGVYPVKGHTAVQIDEETYFKVKDYIYKWCGSGGIRYPEFTKEELKKSLLSEKNGGNEHGYPMPDINFGYRELTYDLSDYCPNCGIGFKQKDAFRLKNVPPVGKKQIFSLGWIFDELFVEKTVYEEIFKPLGIKSREVLKYKKDTPFENTVQLILEETKEKLNLEGYPTENCNVCKRTKYQAMPQGFYPMHKDIIAPIFKSYEYFGSGASAGKKIFVTKELRDKLIDLKIEKIAWYIPTM
ncbi:hypothetical protein [Flavobacterium collinsii]|uniref:Uncharacterized protein n=1 Tax=Flavobacterium collinsii TaxID=1114861 RepID=A0ABM9SFB1_9FLAO|nr:hypothetical protein [Flavobacterium collinsii]CAA9194594.1 hypothetical protein FLACOL7796_00196 [Flavobacterium collinsii]